MSAYVISEDIERLLCRWADENGFSLPTLSFFADLRHQMLAHLEGVFGKRCVEMVSERTLGDGMTALVADTRLPSVSIDKAYFSALASVEINRTVTEDLEDAGSDTRHGHLSLTLQIDALYSQGLREVVLVDDVIFSGHCMQEVIILLRNRGIQVPRAVAGTVVGDGRHVLAKMGVEVRWVRFYDRLIDEVCERDFYPGVPFSGRAVAGQSRDTGAPYIIPFGKPCQWASIPEARAVSFSRFCVQQSIELWRAIEEASGKSIRCCDIPRLPLGAPNDETRFVEFLRSILTRSCQPYKEAVS